MAGADDPKVKAAIATARALLEIVVVNDLDRAAGGLTAFHAPDPPPKMKRGGQKHANWYRDSYIVEAVAFTVECGFDPMVNSATKHKGAAVSACWIVSRALGIKDKAVEKIWTKHGPRIGLREPPVKRRRR